MNVTMNTMQRLKQIWLWILIPLLSLTPNLGQAQIDLEVGGGIGFASWAGHNWLRPQYSIVAPNLLLKNKIGFYFKLEQANSYTSFELPKTNKFIDNWGLTYKFNNKLSAYYGHAILNMQTHHPEMFPFTGRQDLGVSYYPNKIPVSVKVGYTFWLGPHFELTYRILKREGVDSDKDKVRNRFDKCKNTDPRYAGWVNAEGCPLDTDNDHIPDLDDSCKTETGLPNMFGCPDSDGDLVADRLDKCPDIAGLREFKGCLPPPPAPVENKTNDSLIVPPPTVVTADSKLAAMLKEATPHFVFDNSTLLPEFKTKLNLVVDYLKANPEANITLIGHTDLVGSPEYNMNLSVLRAYEAKRYLISKGINAKRIIAIGKGATSPIYLDNSETARMANRRVELIIR